MANIYVTGSMQDAFRIEEVAKIQRERTNNEVMYKPKTYTNMKDHIFNIFNSIKWADVLMVVPAADGTLYTDVLYEMEYADCVNTAIVVLDADEEAVI